MTLKKSKGFVAEAAQKEYDRLGRRPMPEREEAEEGGPNEIIKATYYVERHLDQSIDIIKTITGRHKSSIVIDALQSYVDAHHETLKAQFGVDVRMNDRATTK